MIERTTATGLAVIEHRASEVTPNGNDPADVPPATVGGDTYRPGDPNGLILEDGGPGAPSPRSRIVPSPWSGWPAEWATPLWNGHLETMIDTAWACLDLNASVLAAMPPYLVNPAPSLPAAWLANPDPDHYTSWFEFAKQLAWDYQMGEVFVLCTARYDNGEGWPARFHVVEPWMVNAEMDGGLRRYTIGGIDPGDDLLHIRYKSTTSDARGHGPLEAGRSRLIAAAALARYATTFTEGGGVPYYVITHPDELDKEQADDLLASWWESRTSKLGQPAVLSGGIEIQPLQVSPRDMALLELSMWNESRIATLLGVPAVGQPAGQRRQPDVQHGADGPRAALAGRAQAEGLGVDAGPLRLALAAWNRTRGVPRRVRPPRSAGACPGVPDPYPAGHPLRR